MKDPVIIFKKKLLIFFCIWEAFSQFLVERRVSSLDYSSAVSIIRAFIELDTDDMNQNQNY